MSVKPWRAGWQVYLTVAGKKYRQTVSTEADGKLLEAKWRHAISLGQNPYKVEINQSTGVVSSCTLDFAMDKTYNKYWSGSKNEPAVINLMRAVREYWGKEMALNRISTAAIEDWVEHMKETKKNGTINRHLAIIRKTLKWAYHNEHISKVPLIETQSEVGTERLTWYTEAEEKAILSRFKELKQDYLHDYAVVAVDTGLRASEILKYDKQLQKLKSIRKDGSPVYGLRVSVRKNGTPLVVPLTKRAEAIVRTRNFDTNVHDYQYRKAWDSVRQELGLMDKCWHTWRHTCATRLIHKGLPIERVQKWLGHSTIATTLKYAKLDANNLVDGVDLLEE